MNGTAVAWFTRVTKEYPARGQWLRAVDDVTLRVEAGEILGVLGPNRAGKTTLIKLLLSLCRPSHGQVQRFGIPGNDRTTLARVGYVHEQPAFPRYHTARSLLEYYAALSLLPEEVAQRRTGELLERVSLADRSHEPIARFSKGMLQRLAVAQALLNDPDLLVLDEPGEGLDLVARNELRTVLHERRVRGQTSLLVTHMLDEAERLCDRVAVLLGGKLVFSGPVAYLTKDPTTGQPRTLQQALQEMYGKLP